MLHTFKKGERKLTAKIDWVKGMEECQVFINNFQVKTFPGE